MKEEWDQRYAADEYYYGKDPNPYFKERIDSLVPGRIVMPADGEGRNGVYAASRGWQVTSIDFSEEGRRKALKLAEELRTSLDYQIADLTTFDYGTEKNEAIGLVYAHFYPDIRQSVHRKLLRSLKPGGHIILEAFNKRQINNPGGHGGPPDVERLYTVDILMEDFKEMDILELEEYRIGLDAGKGHSGESEVIRFFGRKR